VTGDLSNTKNENDESKQTELPLTKRTILSRVARTYDPIGFAAGFLIRAKIGIQELWMMGQEWDQELPEGTRKNWSEFFKELEHLNTVEFPRCLTPLSANGAPMLCVFADVSRKAFGACAYIRWQIDNVIGNCFSPTLKYHSQILVLYSFLFAVMYHSSLSRFSRTLSFYTLILILSISCYFTLISLLHISQCPAIYKCSTIKSSIWVT
jgi:hypothetical protein